MAFLKIDDDWTKWGAIHSKEVAERFQAGMEILYAMVPVGGIYPIMVGIPNVPTPDVDVWQECDGSEITNPNSPLRSLPGQPRYTPNMQDHKYPRITKTLGVVGTFGGTNDADFEHTHTTSAHEHAVKDCGFGGKDSQKDVKAFHIHSTPPDMEILNAEPEYITIRYFMRIQ